MRRRDFIFGAASLAACSDGESVRRINNPGRALQIIPWDVNGIVVTGQSTSVGAHSLPVSTTSQPYNNDQVWDSSGAYDITKPNAGTLGVRPLIAWPTDRQNNDTTNQYPANLFGESPDVRMVIQLSEWIARSGSPSFSTTCDGISGEPLTYIEKGSSLGNSYAASLFEVQVRNRLALAVLQTYGVLAVILDHGQADASNATYGAGVVAMQASYQSDLQALTGQSRAIPLFVTQQHSEPYTYAGPGSENLSALQQLAICQANPTALVGAMPGYQYAMFSDNIHYPTPSTLLRGEMLAFVLWQLLLGNTWGGCWPTSASRTGNAVTVEMNVPLDGSLTLDTTAIAPPHQTGPFTLWANGYGWEAWSGGYGGTPVGITSISLGAQGLQINTVSPADTVCYAHTPDIQGQGATGGRLGNLRGSVAHPAGISGVSQYDWAWECSLTGL